jgi:hypothetical protein
MIRKIRDLLFAPAEFESSFGLSESVERLNAATRRSVSSATTRQEVVGTVTGLQVSLYGFTPLVHNSFKPFFRGRFIQRNGKVILAGRFTMHPYVKTFMTFWFGFGGWITLLGFLHPRATSNPWNGVGIIVVGIVILTAGRRLARDDAAWLSDVIRRALQAQLLAQPEDTEI